MNRVETGQTKPRWSGVRKAMAAGLVLAATATAATFTWAQMGPSGHGMGGHGMDGMALFGGSPEHAGRMIDHMLDGLSATDAQRAQIKQIALAAAADLKPQRDAGRALRDKSLQVFTAANVDANAAEQLRAQMVAQHDQMSRRTLTAMLDISRVLTPDQRVKLAQRAQERGDAMRERMQRMERARPTP